MKRILIFTVIAISALIIAVIATFFAVKGRNQLYWISVIGILLFSYLYGFSLAQTIICLAFIPITIAIKFAFGLIRNKYVF